MTQLSPRYFDNELVSANVQQPIYGDGERFRFEVNINHDRLRAAIADILSEYGETVDRWHVDTEKNVDTLETVEGAAIPPELGAQSRPTIT